jgi:hypothetical protein
MSASIDQAFIKQFESEVHTAYQRMGSKFRNCVRWKGSVKGTSTTFQKVGKGTAATKTRHGNAPLMSIDHTPVECTLSDWYAADYIDKLDELKINHDERSVVATAAAAALGRKTDDLILTAMQAGTQVVAVGTTGLTQAKINTVFNAFGLADVPDDGERYWAIGPNQWTNLLGIDAFSSADFIGPDELPYKGGMIAKRWLGFMWMTHSGLPLATADRSTFAWHRTAIGAASGQDVTTELNYVAEKAAHLGTSMMSQGAALIDNTGVYEVVCLDTWTVP